MGAPSPETLLGVLFDLKIGLDDFDLLFTDRRVVAAKTGTSGMGHIVGGVVGAVILSALERTARDRYAGLSPEQILHAHKRNFAIPFASVESAELNGGIPSITIPSLTFRAGGKKTRFGMMSSFWKKDQASIANAKELLRVTLGAKAEFKKV